ncbi:MAG: hypothetical protein KBA95_17505 [Acidobacteria bacterium]|jgi:hypothetical protein|nr:hypothetical protein [Acidobacteriota bacterium]
MTARRLVVAEAAWGAAAVLRSPATPAAASVIDVWDRNCLRFRFALW